MIQNLKGNLKIKERKMKHLAANKKKQENEGLETLSDDQLSLVRGGDQQNAEVGDDEEA